MNHRYKIEGVVNGRPILGHGNGKIDPVNGVSEMEVHFEAIARGWDPRSIVLMCCDRALIMASREEDGAVSMLSASGGFVTIGKHLAEGDRWGCIRDINGIIFANMHASSITDLRDENQRYDFSWVKNGICHMEPGKNGIKSIPPFTGIMMQAGPNLITITTNYEVETEDGQRLFGFTFYPHFLPEQKKELLAIQKFNVHAVEQEFVNNRLFVRTVSSVSLLSAAEMRNVNLPKIAVNA